MGRTSNSRISVCSVTDKSHIQRQLGWRTIRHPSVGYFLAYVSQFCEIVLFTTQYNYVIAPLTGRMSPYSHGFHTAHKLFRDATKSLENGYPVKVCIRTFPMLDMEVKYVLPGPLTLEPRLDQSPFLDTDPEHCKSNVSPTTRTRSASPSGRAHQDKGQVALTAFLECRTLVRRLLRSWEGAYNVRF